MVTCAITRSSHTEDVSSSQEFCTAALSGTYTTGGFTTNPFGIVGGPGTSPLSGTKVRAVQWLSPLGYIYVSTVTGVVMTTKIFSAANVEFTNGTAVPDASIPLIITKSKV